MILVVEDHEETRWVLLRLLERRGYEAMGVADGAAVLQLLREQWTPTTTTPSPSTNATAT